MPSTHSSLPILLQQLLSDFSEYLFVAGDIFSWSPKTQIITYNPHDQDASWLLIHELAHAELGHSDYQQDIQLLRFETDAWYYAANTLSSRYGISINEEFIQNNLDGYRRWLYTRSLCPHCGQTGIQTNKNAYSCINCRHSWRVNDARQCSLRRFTLPDQDHS